MEILDVRPWLDGVAAGEVAVWPTEEDVTCKIEAADVENIAPQSAVGEFSGVAGCELWYNKDNNQCQCQGCITKL